jgi:hypothetical protein
VGLVARRTWRVDLTGVTGYLSDFNVRVVVGSERKPGQDRDAFAGGDEGFHDNHVVAEEPDAWSEAFFPTHGE